MKIKHIVLASAVLVSVSSFAQKDELKSLKKIYGKGEVKGNDLIEYKALVNKVEPLATEEGDKIYAGFYRAMIPALEVSALDLKSMTPQQMQMSLAKVISPKAITDLAVGLNATLDYEKKTGKKIYTDEINEVINEFKPNLIDYALALGKMNKNKEAADVLYAIYTLDKKDQDMLFYAASYAVNAVDYDAALKYYGELKAANYSGEGTVYYAVNNTSKVEENFGNNKKLRDLMITTSHSKPRDEKIPSKRGEIYKNIALILKEKGKTAEALTAITDARKENPNDDSLILAEAELYLANKDFDTYTKLVNQALEKNPNNADLVYNLAVISANNNKLDEAEKYYKRALEIDGNYFNALLNLSELKLRADEKLVTEMNKLGTSDKDNKRYEVIKAEREKNFKSILPYLEKAVELKPTDEPASKTLLSVYRALEMTDKASALKAKMGK
ncbi:tetratricopeptide repeat protein [Flavobacterium wongokense]|uniref:tetratricopeptide repeat protein n=1 Tax=Flavobacterium wongokense TaxID=2910674 RepID=UPI001F158412|nr:tetratricopeptide repeat protein [Flavobacterium sp. WG47]MCF6132279.1 tetratricopeptide repeat protein [Flavobacterium sp. WG47]